uniref:Uncharacterized protein n=1 Tax=Glossina palpalis gambiensis TaxID=67801 RepID=A0A1B0AYJ2_9MUSC
MPGSAHQQQMPQSMSTGNNTIGGHGGHDRGGGGAGGGGGGGGGMPVAGPGGPHCQMSGSQPLVMPAFPLRNSHSAHTPHYSPYSPSRKNHERSAEELELIKSIYNFPLIEIFRKQ